MDGFTKEQLGNNIAVFLPNSISYAKAYFSILFQKKTVIPIPIYSKPDEIGSNLLYCEINLLITDKSGIEQVRKMENYKKRLLVFLIDSKTTVEINPEAEYTCTQITDENADVAVMLHTSGTTSNPKRVMLKHRGLLMNINSNILSLNLNSNDVSLISLPMCFGYCNTAQFLTHFCLGGSIVILDNILTGKAFFKLVEQYRITNFTAVPTMLQIIDKFSKYKEYDTSSLRYICFGGGNVATELIDSLIDKFPYTDVVQTYGQTEAGPRVTALHSADYKTRRGSVGSVIPNVTVKIVDDDGNELKDDEIGNIIVNSPSIMKGYYKNPEVTEQTIRNGWLYTGDMGHLKDGFLYLNGRKKNMIICGGLNIYPEEIEELIQGINGVKAVKVYGRDDDIWGEIPIASIVLEEGAEFDGVCEAIRNSCKKSLSEYKIPREINQVEEFERTYTGKIRRTK